jgi:pyruvate,water dikinase
MKTITGDAWRVACHGRVSGRAVIIRSQTDLQKVCHGDVMIAVQTDMNYTPQMLLSVAILTEEGGRYSHAAIFSRENNIPCIVGIDGIMLEVKDDDLLVVDTATKSIIIIPPDTKKE